MSLRRIFALLLFVFGTASLIFGVWLYTNSLNNSFAAMMFAVGGVVMIAIAVLVYRSTSFLEVIRAIASWMLILAGISIILWGTLFVNVNTPYMILVFGIGLALGTLGWTLLKTKFFMSIQRRILSGVCLTCGGGSLLFSFFLILYRSGLDIAFVGIAPICVIAGVALVVFGVQLRRPPKTEED